MAEAQQDLDLSQCALAVRLVLERADLLNGHSELVHIVKSRAKGSGDGGKEERDSPCNQIGEKIHSN